MGLKTSKITPGWEISHGTICFIKDYLVLLFLLMRTILMPLILTANGGIRIASQFSNTCSFSIKRFSKRLSMVITMMITSTMRCSRRRRESWNRLSTNIQSQLQVSLEIVVRQQHIFKPRMKANRILQSIQDLKTIIWTSWLIMRGQLVY